MLKKTKKLFRLPFMEISLMCGNHFMKTIYFLLLCSKKRKSKGINVHGFDSDSSITEHAIKSDVIDQSVSALESINSKEYAKDLDLIIIAVPPKQTLDVLNNLYEVWNTNTTITDTSSVKNHIKIITSKGRAKTFFT